MWNRIAKHHLFWPLAVLAALLLFNLIYKPDFFSVRIQGGHLYGSLIDILNYGAPLILVAIGMTLVIATGGIDLSVGSIVAISGAIACLLVSKATDQNALGIVLAAVGLALGLSIVCGLWNGILVAGAGMQAIIATLILMVAGRGIAQLVTSGQIITVSSNPYKYIGAGWLVMLPFSIFIVAAVWLAAAWLTRRTALGLFIESVGSNKTASRLAGIRSRSVIFAVYIFCGLCAGLAGIILSSNVSSADGNNAGLWYELDAILAVVIGGTSLNGGRFYLSGTVVGALIIQTLTTTIYMIGVPPEITLVVKAFVVFAVCLIQSEKFRAVMTGKGKKRRAPVEREVTQHG
jgi:ribose/xylose/arabinose/galactoside ABC-type transport system permease subunit